MSFQSLNPVNKSKSLVSLSKSLAYVLRHGAAKEGLTINSEGFIRVDDLLKNKLFSNTNIKEIQEVVDTNDKKRFHMELKSDGIYYIRANQGHTLESVDQVEMTQVLSVDQVGTVFHGTYRKHLQSILSEGLKRMDRNHIHLVNKIEGQEITSGMRGSCNMIIYIDVPLLLQDGIKLYLSANNVALTEGLNDTGLLPPKYFIKITDAKNGVTIWQR
ncbi:hypothetical protein RB653_000080 [Dictyostelium firmibasis]|uniref:2'-phosphotransferase n=1 Tax=Dictyostelium firmibasis TaxID=79012 RepID=A0AAN7TW30_9MYCE